MESDAAKVQCIGCGGLVAEVEGPVHRYLEASPGCWRVYGEVLAREYSDLAFWAVHRLTVDSYAVQHPGQRSPQTIQSVCVHLLSLYLVLERGADPEFVTRAMQAMVRQKDRFAWLTPPSSRGRITVADITAASTPAEHGQRVRAWAESAWSAWAPHHEIVRGWAASVAE